VKGPRRPWLGRVPLLLGRRWLPAVSIAAALLLVLPCLRNGRVGDDFMHMARVDPRLQVPGFSYAPLDLFTFVSGDPTQRAVLLQEGVFGWWTAPDFRMSFWRPLSSLTHVVDHLLWPRSSMLAHAHSMLWFAALLGVVAALYRRFHGPCVAHLALLLYAIDDARGWVLGWTANRNALVAATLAFAALLAFDRARRDGWRPGNWLAPALFALALLGGESALAVTAYFFAYTVFVDQGSLARRLGRLFPYAALSVAWLVAYKALGYGTTGGGMYLNPLDQPGPYLRALVERLPVLLAAQVGLRVSDAWLLLTPRYLVVAYLLALLLLAVFAMALAPVWRRQPVCRFWALGAVLSLPPACAAFPMDRLLVFAGVGIMAAIALLLAEWLEGAVQVLSRARRAMTSTVVALLAASHLLLAPLLLPLRVLVLGYMATMGQTLEASIPKDEAVRTKTLVILSSSAELTTFPAWMQRQVLGTPRPRHMRLLATCFADLRVTRVDSTILRLRPERGFLDNEMLRMARGLSRPFRPGDSVALPGLRVRVNEVTADGRPAEADFDFGRPLEDTSLLWTRLRAGGTLDPWSPPAVGKTVLLPSIAPRPINRPTHLMARTSAAKTAGLIVRALRMVRRMEASRNPADRNSSRKAPPSLAPAIQANQLDSLARSCCGSGCRRISSAANNLPPGRKTRASSEKMACLAGLRLKMPLTNAVSISPSPNGSLSASVRQKSTLWSSAWEAPWRALSSMGTLKSTPMTIPSKPTRRAAIRESRPAPQPRSRTVAPGESSANIETFETPENAPLQVSGSISSRSHG